MEELDFAVELELVEVTVGTVTEDWLVVVSLDVEVEVVAVVELEVVDDVLIVELSVVGLDVVDNNVVGGAVCVDVVSLVGLFCLFPNSAIFRTAPPSCWAVSEAILDSRLTSGQVVLAEWPSREA